MSATDELAQAQSAGGEAGAEPADQAERPARDRPPRKRTKRRAASSTAGGAQQLRGAAKKQQSKQLESKLAELLMFPAMPVSMFASDPGTQAYMIEHFTRSGPRTASILVEASETNAQLRELLERVTTGSSMFTVVLALTTYAAPPAMWMLGMRQQAAIVTQASTMTEQDLARIMAEANAAAATYPPSPDPAEQPGAEGTDDAEAPAPGAGSPDYQPPA